MAKRKTLKRATAAAVEGAAPCSLLAEKIEAMATIMADTAADMEYYGGFSKRIEQHAKDLKGAAKIAKTWARGIRKNTANGQGSADRDRRMKNPNPSNAATAGSGRTASDCSGLTVCAKCPDKKQCKSYGECLADSASSAAQIEDDYISAGVCSDCGACSLIDANNKCRPKQYPSGEWSCAGEKLWQDDEDQDAADDWPND